MRPVRADRNLRVPWEGLCRRYGACSLGRTCEASSRTGMRQAVDRSGAPRTRASPRARHHRTDAAFVPTTRLSASVSAPRATARLRSTPTPASTPARPRARPSPDDQRHVEGEQPQQQEGGGTFGLARVHRDPHPARRAGPQARCSSAGDHRGVIRRRPALSRLSGRCAGRRQRRSANTPSSSGRAVKPAASSRRVTSLGTSRPEVRRFGAPV